MDGNITQLQEELRALRDDIEQIRSMTISRDQSEDMKKEARDVIYRALASSLWDEVYYTSNFASASITTTSTSEVFDANGRESDTSGGLYFLPSRESRFRAIFYLNTAQTKSEVYITSPATSQASTVGTAMADTDKSWVGVFIDETVVKLVSYNHNDASTTTVTTTETITDNTTHVLEIRYHVGHAEIYLDNASIGTIPCKLIDDTSITTFFPFLTSIKSTDGTSVNLTIESYEFLQSRK